MSNISGVDKQMKERKIEPATIILALVLIGLVIFIAWSIYDFINKSILNKGYDNLPLEENSSTCNLPV